MNQLTPHQVLAMLAGDLALQTSESLFQLKNDAADLQALAKAVVDHLDRALDLKYSKQAHALRLAAGKDTGVVHLMTAMFRSLPISPKKSIGIRKKLADLVRRMTANGDNPAEYVEISYRVSETKFNAWPER